MPQGRHTPVYQPNVMALGNRSFEDMLLGSGREQLFVSDSVRKAILQAVDQIPALKELGVVAAAIGRDVSAGADSAAKWGTSVLRTPAREGLAKVMVMFGPPPSQPPTIPEPNAAQRVLAEAASTLLSCGSAAVCWVGVVGGGLAAPETGGASLLVSIYTGTAAIGGSVQCLEGIARMIIAATPDGKDKLAKLDEADWYQRGNLVIDAYVLFGGILIAKETLKVLSEAAKENRQLPSLLKGKLTRDQAKAFMETFMANASKDATVITAQLKKQLCDYISLALGSIGSLRDENGALQQGMAALGKALRYAEGETVELTVALVQ